MRRIFFKYGDNYDYVYPRVNENPILNKKSDFNPNEITKVEFPQDQKLFAEIKETIIEVPSNDNAYNSVYEILSKINVNYLNETRRGYNNAQLIDIASKVGIKTSGKNKTELIKNIKSLMESYNILK